MHTSIRGKDLEIRPMGTTPLRYQETGGHDISPKLDDILLAVEGGQRRIKVHRLACPKGDLLPLSLATTAFPGSPSINSDQEKIEE